ncbi:MAG: histidine kinase [Saprospiraceae bacterium]
MVQIASYHQTFFVRLVNLTKQQLYLSMIAIIIIILSSSCLWAQNPHPYFRNFTTDDGLPSSEVYYCIQDTNGYMWFATDNGLSRFDGYEFKNYGSREGLKHNVVFYMQKDPQGKIWLATMHGHLYYIDGDSIQAFTQNNVIEKINDKPNFIKDFYIDTAGNKYLSIVQKGILKFSVEGHYEQILSSTPNVQYVAINPDRRLILGGQEISNALLEAYKKPQIDFRTKKLIEVIADSIYYINYSFLSKNWFSSGAWIKRMNNNSVIGLNFSILYESKMGEIIWQRPVDFDLELKSFVQDSKDRLLLGLLRGKGIRRYQDIDALREDQFEQFLEGISVTQIFEDQRGGYWIGTIENGVFYCPDFDLKIYDESSGFPNNHITAVDFKTKNQAYIGFRDGQVILFDFPNNQLDRMPSLKNNIVYDLLFDTARQELWATNGLPNVLAQGKWQTLRSSKSSTTIFAKKMTISRDGHLIWGGIHVGFGSVDLATKKKHLVAYDIGIRNRTFRVWEDQGNRIWVGNVNGIFEFKNNKLVPPQPFFEPFNTRAEDIAELSDGTLVIATKGEGLLLWKDDFFHQLTTNEGLSSNMLENVCVDEKDQIFAGSLEGLNRIIRKDGSYWLEKYTTFHGLPSNEITKVTSQNGQIWVATTKGLLKWKAKTQSDFSSTPFFERTLVNNAPVDLEKHKILKYRQNDLEFHFLTINYNQNGKIPYRFRLNNGTWNYTQARAVNFVDLAPNNYQLDVQSQNENGVWSASKTIGFVIQPAFWQTLWFKFLGAGFLLGISWLVYRIRLQQFKAAAQIEKEMLELQRSALRAQMNPHFIFNCLNSIQNFILKNDQKNATIYLAKFAQLIRDTLNASMEEKISLNTEVALLENYLNLEKLRFKEKFDFQIRVDDHLDALEIMLPPLITQPFVENAILHGLAKMDSGGQIKIDFLKANEQLEIRIQDNGPGIFQAQKSKMAVQSKHQHKKVGMSISQKRLKLADQLNVFEVKEIKGQNGEVKGTLVKMTLEI